MKKKLIILFTLVSITGCPVLQPKIDIPKTEVPSTHITSIKESSTPTPVNTPSPVDNVPDTYPDTYPDLKNIL